MIFGDERWEKVTVEEVGEITDIKQLVFYVPFAGPKSFKKWKEEIKEQYNNLKPLGGLRKLPKIGWLYKLIFYGDRMESLKMKIIGKNNKCPVCGHKMKKTKKDSSIMSNATAGKTLIVVIAYICPQCNLRQETIWTYTTF